MSPDFDKLRDKVGIDKLNDVQRKKLFEDFIDHGGHIIDDKRQKRQREGVTEKDIKSRVRAEKRGAHQARPSETAAIKRPAKQQLERRAVSTIPGRTVTERKKKSRPFALLKINIKGLFLKVFALGGNRFSDKFIEFIRGEGKSHFLNLNLITGSFLSGNSAIKKDILRLSKGENSTFYELIFRLHTLYDENEYSSIEKSIAKKVIPGGPYLEIFKVFFKKMYIIGQFSDLCKLFIQKAIDIQVQKKLLESDAASSLRLKLKTAVDVILVDLMAQFHVTLCKMAGTYYPLYSQKLDDFLGMTEQDKIGYVTRMERLRRAEELKKMKEYLKRKQIQPQEEEEVKVPKHIERGIPLLEESINNYETAHRYDENNPLQLLNSSDKMYRSAILLEVFDREYSFILTTGKISFNIDYREQKKVDIKEDLNRAYLPLSEARQAVKDYIKIIRELKETDSNIRLTVHQKSVMHDKLVKKQSILSRSSRRRVAEVMKTIQEILSTVINDYKTSHRLLQNPDEKLVFDEKIDGVKKLNNRKIIEAIVEAFLFTSTLSFLLNYGELSGSGLLIERKTGTEKTTASS